MKTVKEQLADCTPDARTKAEKDLRETVIASRQALRMLTIMIDQIIEKFDNVSVPTAISIGLWAADAGNDLVDFVDCIAQPHDRPEGELNPENFN